MEFFLAGNVLHRCRTSFIRDVSSCRRALLLGEGPGRFLVELLRANSSVEVTCVEQSSRMIQEARRAVARQGLNGDRIIFEQANVLDWQPSGAAFDLVVTNFFLDCFRGDELERIVANVAASATDDARWLVADFRLPEFGWRRWRARLVLALMYGFFRHATGLSASRLTPPGGFLSAAGFRLVHQRLANFGLTHADFWLRAKV